jgi:DNA-binding MarR family transcriptional regulator
MSDIEPEICNCAALRQVARRVTKIYDDALAPSGLGVNQFSILARLGLVGPSTIQDLARLLVMDRSTLGHLLRPLDSAA